MTSNHQRLGVVFGCLFVAVSAASGQTPLVIPADHAWSHGSTLNVFGGGAATSGDYAAAAGGACGWELTPRFALEGSGTWLDWGQQSHAFAAMLTTRVAVLTPHPVVPFLAAGMGVYHATFGRFDAAMPRFYRHRMAGFASGPGRMMAFTDPSLVGGGGFDVFLSRHWTIRPEVMANVVLRDSYSFVATTGVVRLGYHFEDHPVTQ